MFHFLFPILSNDSKTTSPSKIGSLIDDLQADSRSLDLFIRNNLLGNNTTITSERILLIIDQFEELFTLCKNSDRRTAFIENLLVAASTNTLGPIQIIIVLRADFYSYWIESPQLSSIPHSHQINISSMNQDNFRHIIEEPAKQNGLQIEPELVTVLLREVENQRDILPLLSHALLETWKRRQGSMLTLRGYQESGGIEKAISRTAESVFNHFDQLEQKIAKNVFLRLIEPREDMLEVRRLALIDELIPFGEKKEVVQSILAELAGSHLLNVGKSRVQISHEALIGNWERLRSWLEKDKELLFVHRRLIEASRQWKQQNQDVSFLVEGKQLHFYEEWLKINVEFASSQEIEFIEASRLEEKHKLEQRERIALLEQSDKIIRRRFVQITSILLATSIIVLSLLALFKISIFSPLWQPITPIFGGNTWNILLQHDQPNVAYVGSSDNGVYRSEDNGLTWTVANTGIANKRISLLISDPQNNNIIYGNAGEDGIVMTSDSGENWFQINDGLPLPSILTDIAFSHYPTTTLYAAIWGYGVWSTPISNINWKPTLGVGLPNNNVHDIEVVANSDGELLAAISHQGLFKSNDFGNSWESIGFQNQDVTRIDTVPWDSTLIHIQVASTKPYISLDSGTSWQPLSNDINNNLPRSFSYNSGSKPRNLFIGTRNGLVFRSNENEALQYWESIWSNLPSALIRDIEFPSNDTFLLSTSHGVYTSEDDGNTWTLTGPEILPADSIILLPSSSSDDVRDLLVTTNAGIYQGSGLFVKSWTALNNGLDSLEIAEIAPVKNNHQDIFAILTNGNLYRLSENRLNWGLIDIPSNEKVISVENFYNNNLNGLFIATNENNIYAKSEHDQQWILLWQSPSTPTKMLSTSNAIYIGTAGHGIYKSTNSGETWKAINAGITNSFINDLTVAQNVLYAATKDGVFSSYNEGQNWTHSTKGLQNRQIETISVHPKYPNLIYAGSPSGLYISVDHGGSWQTLDKGLETKDVRIVITLMDYVFISTSTGIYYMKHPVTPLVSWHYYLSGS